MMDQLDHIEFTPTQTILYDVLKDGKAHTPSQLNEALGGEEQDLQIVKLHIHRMRKRMILHGYDILYRNGVYRIVRVTHDPNDGVH